VGATAVDIRVLVDRSIVEVFVGGGRVAAVMAYQPPNDVSDTDAMGLENFTSVHLFADQSQAVANVSIHQMGCAWNQTAPK
jgi:sucrose-6-phosphate hydrolase SacC (GH32 family)